MVKVWWVGRDESGISGGPSLKHDYFRWFSKYPSSNFQVSNLGYLEDFDLLKFRNVEISEKNH